MKTHELFIQLRKQSKPHTQILSRLFCFKTWCMGTIWNQSKFTDKCWQWSLNISSRSQQEQRQSRAPHHQASSLFLAYIQCKMRPLLQYVPWKTSLDKLPVTLAWSKLGWRSQRNNSWSQKIFDSENSMPSTARNFSSNILQQPCVLASLQDLGLNRRCHAQAAVGACGPETVHRGICPSMSAI